jgi:hypothetical protein
MLVEPFRYVQSPEKVSTDLKNLEHRIEGKLYEYEQKIKRLEEQMRVIERRLNE